MATLKAHKGALATVKRTEQKDGWSYTVFLTLTGSGWILKRTAITNPWGHKDSGHYTRYKKVKDGVTPEQFVAAYTTPGSPWTT